MLIQPWAEITLGAEEQQENEARDDGRHRERQVDQRHEQVFAAEAELGYEPGGSHAEDGVQGYRDNGYEQRQLEGRHGVGISQGADINIPAPLHSFNEDGEQRQQDDQRKKDEGDADEQPFDGTRLAYGLRPDNGLGGQSGSYGTGHRAILLSRQRAPAGPPLDVIDEKQHGERDDEQHKSDRRRLLQLERLQLRHDQQRSNLRAHRHVAGDEDDGAVFADAPGERKREAGQERRRQLRQHDAQNRAPSSGSKHDGRLLDLCVQILQYGLDSPDDEGQTNEDQGDRNAERREGHLDAKRLQPFSDPAVRRVDGRQGDAGDCGRKRERQVDEAVQELAARKRIAYQHPCDDEAEHDVDDRRRQRSQQADAVGSHDAGSGHRRPELSPAELRRLEQDARQRNQHDDAKVEHGDAHRQSESG
ncbi:hypothetical protein BN871_AL_00280 [Paenibacillus sp. P22]|nr:hypothetical protein BN871_AL_00280 [Paenibacillus sp. P22]